jgi:hypothetical protein
MVQSAQTSNLYSTTKIVLPVKQTRILNFATTCTLVSIHGVSPFITPPLNYRAKSNTKTAEITQYLFIINMGTRSMYKIPYSPTRLYEYEYVRSPSMNLRTWLMVRLYHAVAIVAACGTGVVGRPRCTPRWFWLARVSVWHRRRVQAGLTCRGRRGHVLTRRIVGRCVRYVSNCSATNARGSKMCSANCWTTYLS